MGDNFNISRVDVLKNFDITMNEVSDVSTIVREMIAIKSDKKRIIKKQTLAYSIEDKLKLNQIKKSLAELITRKHIDAYDVIEEAIKNLEEFDVCIREDLYDYYYEVYINILIEMEIEWDDLLKIKDTSSKIYMDVNSTIKKQLFENKASSIPENKIETYISAITSYVFYKCKFLIPFE